MKELWRVESCYTVAIEHSAARLSSGREAIACAVCDAELLQRVIIRTLQQQPPPTNAVPQPLRQHGVAQNMIGQFSRGKWLPVIVGGVMRRGTVDSAHLDFVF